MKKRDALLLRADSRGLVDETNAGCATSLESSVEVVDSEANMVNTGATFGHISRNRRLRCFRFEQFNQRFASSEADDSCTVGVVEGDFREIEDVAIERQDLFEGPHRNSNVCDAGSPTG